MKLLLPIIFCFIFTYSLYGQDSLDLVKTSKIIYKKGNVLKGVKILNKYIVIDPNNHKTLRLRGHCYRTLGKYDLAEIDLLKSLRLDSTEKKTYNDLAVVYTLTERYKLAILHYDKAIALDTNYATAYANRGSMYNYFLEQDERALKDLTKAVNLDTNNAYSYYNRAILYKEMGNCIDGIKDFNSSLRINPKDHQTHYVRAQCYFNTGDYKKALNDFRKANKYNTRIDPFEAINEVDLLLYIAECHEILENAFLAKKNYKKVDKLKMKNNS